MKLFNKIKELFNMHDDVDLKEIIAKGALVVDVRTVSEYKDGHIKGSLNIPLDSIYKEMSWLIKDTPIITVCASGARSAHAKEILKTNGFKEVYNGGSWNNLGNISVGSCHVK